MEPNQQFMENRVTVSGQSHLGIEHPMHDRLEEILGQIPNGKQLRPAAAVAAAQLEQMTKVSLQVGPGGQCFGRFVFVPIGTLLFVIADGERICTIHAGIAAGATPRSIINEAMASAARHGQFNETSIVGLMKGLLETAGTGPGKRGPDLGPEVYPVLGGMFSAIPDHMRGELAKSIDENLTEAICPVAMGLIGPAESGRANMYCLAWPLVLPLAYYAEYAMRLTEGRRPDA